MRLKSTKILVVADQDYFTDMVKLLLTKLTPAPQTFTAQNSADALTILEANQIDLVTTDIYRKHDSGIEFLSEVKKRFPALPVIVMGGAGRPEDIAEITRLGGYRFSMPFACDMFLQLVSNFTGASWRSVTAPLG